MNLQQKTLEVKTVFDELDVEAGKYISNSNLTCFTGCGQCCANPKINASVLEFLPLAFDLYKKGKAEEVLELLSNEKISDEYCILYKSTGQDNRAGSCSDYNNRGLICRLFGNSSRKNKNGEKEIVTCKKIKTGKNEQFLAVSNSIKIDLEIPSGTDFYYRLNNIDSQLTEDQFPINVAIKKSLEAVLRFMFYQENQEV